MMVVPICCHSGKQFECNAEEEAGPSARRKAARFHRVPGVSCGFFFSAPRLLKNKKKSRKLLQPALRGSGSISGPERLAKPSSSDEDKLETGSFLFIESGNTDCYMLYLTNPPHPTHVG